MAIGTLYMPVVVLIAAALAIATPAGKKSIYDAGPQGFSETVYAYTSQTNNNGSAFAGYTGFLQPNAPGNAGATGVTFADLIGGLCMMLGRFIPLLAALAVAGSLAAKRPAPAGPGTFRTDSPVFLVLLVGVVVIVAALSFLPALALGPIVQGLTNQLFWPIPRRQQCAETSSGPDHRPRPGLPAGHDRRGPGRLQRPGQRQPGRAGQQRWSARA